MVDVLNIKNLTVSFAGYDTTTHAVRGISFAVCEGEVLALVGESGSGKSVTAHSLLGLNPSPPAHVSADVLKLGGFDVLSLTEKELEQLRGGVAGMVFQDPMTCLNPTMKIGRQITERLYRKEGFRAAQCKAEAVRLLELVQIPDAALRAGQYPHQFSGGMRQRVMLAMALACRPRLLIADEPTTALDVTTQLQILKLIAHIRREMGTAILLITHDFGVVANLADRVAVMYAGKIVEEGRTEDLLCRPGHPYTQELLKSLSQLHSTEGPSAMAGGILDRAVPATGCVFAARCPHCMNVCVQDEPPLFSIAEGHGAACWRHYPKEA